MTNNQKDLVSEARIKVARFCSYRERAPQEVRRKLNHYGLNDHQVEEVLKDLKAEDFVNESRFASAYANGKLRINKWGKIKIKQGLEHHGIKPDLIDKVIRELPEDRYRATLINHIQRKNRTLDTSDTFIRNHRIAQFAISKGFEPDMVWEYLNHKS